MKFWASMPGMSLYPGDREHWWRRITTEELQAVAIESDRLGYDAIVIPEHIVMSASRVGEMGPRWVHSLSAAGFVLGATTRISVACLVVVPLHNPIELAKALSTLDYLSGGRLLPVCMVGEQAWEYETLRSPPFEQRGKVMDEYLDAMIELWTAPEPRFRGEHVSFEDVVFDPRPAAPLPLWFGGRTRTALRRLARVGAGWMNAHVAREDIPAFLDFVAAERGPDRAGEPVEVYTTMWDHRRDPQTHALLDPPRFAGGAEAVFEQLEELRAAGVTATGVDMALGSTVYGSVHEDAPEVARSCGEYLDRLAWFAEEVMPHARGPLAGATP
jgi:alkanesulfonate monooxygenase SsuD/methylene tetrahydromethanopterin reductase-like flavin-dependent oxidoreductase (luciferase family)